MFSLFHGKRCSSSPGKINVLANLAGMNKLDILLTFVQLSLRKELQLVVEVGVGPEWHLKPEGDVM
jgi:hypothetical protein